LYLIPYIVGYNFDTDRFPKLCVRNLGDTRDQQQFAAALANLVDKEIITPDMITEQWARKQFQMPRKIEDRPEFSPSQVRKIVNESIVDGASGQVGKPNDNTSTVGNNGGRKYGKGK
jgi:phage gp29-like protein